GPVTEKSDVVLVPYSKEYQEQYKKLYNGCYHGMREALGIKPFDFIQDDSFFAQGMENVYLLIEDGELIGSVALKGDEIDDLLVKKEYQGRGCGRQILLWALENINSSNIILHVAEWNARAVRLYKSVGFEITKTIEI
ncbi:MAG: GNAT family N-acetyltransferase, partial [Clostridiales bacterium]|nr:GNAT family N-acetyltransferase [Clostridiales bacterium]